MPQRGGRRYRGVERQPEVDDGGETGADRSLVADAVGSEPRASESRGERGALERRERDAATAVEDVDALEDDFGCA
jgi:hypothetical protein